MTSLCESCAYAGTYCPVWHAGKQTDKCVAYGPETSTDQIEEEIRQEDS